MSSDVSSLSIPVGAQPDAIIANNIRPLDGRDVRISKDDKKFNQTLQDYEGVFLSQMVSHMYEGIEVDPNFGGGVGEETMRSLLIEQYGKKMAAAGGIGMAAQMKKQLLEAQEQSSQPQNLPIQNNIAPVAVAAESEKNDGAR